MLLRQFGHLKSKEFTSSPESLPILNVSILSFFHQSLCIPHQSRFPYESCIATLCCTARYLYIVSAQQRGLPPKSDIVRVNFHKSFWYKRCCAARQQRGWSQISGIVRFGQQNAVAYIYMLSRSTASLYNSPMEIQTYRSPRQAAFNRSYIEMYRVQACRAAQHCSAKRSYGNSS